MRRTKTGYTWIGLVLAALLGILVLSFILQNLDTVDLHLLFWDFSLPLGVTVLLSVIVGVLLTALVGGARIMQLRRAAKRG
ncbi:LapA family protein [Nocardia paucivorans]|uniref:LapA family protein n=1 Tax=Nocardia paucivorans TaxID=114259 RepID=UPI0002F1A00B|nr:lipopolysaccharide assembly protein LapA domain-containing protein [Nocardia paucivorans]